MRVSSFRWNEVFVPWSTERSDVLSVQLPVSGSRRGQASLELLVTLGVVLAFTIPVVFLLLSVSSAGYENAARDQADATARSLGDSINNVYGQGDGAKRIVLLNAPGSTESIEIKGKEVVVSIRTSQGIYEGVSPVFAEVAQTPPITGRTGLFSVTLKTEGGEVEINEE